MSFTTDMLRSRLTNTNESTDSITATAQWILFHKRQAPTIAREWAQFLHSRPEKLNPIYIANEVIQQSKFKRKGDFVAAFAPVLPDALAAAHSSSNLPTRDRIVRVVKVWRDRGIFSPEEQQKIETAISKGLEVPSELASLVRLFGDWKSLPSADSVQAVINELKNVEKMVVNAKFNSNSVNTNGTDHNERYTAQDAMPFGQSSDFANNDAMSDDDDDIGYAPED